MMMVGTELCRVAVVPRDDSAEALFPLYLALVRGLKIWSKNLVPDIYSLMRAFVVVIRQPFMVDMIKMIQAKTNEVVKALFFNDTDTGFGVPVWIMNQLHLIGTLRRRLFV